MSHNKLFDELFEIFFVSLPEKMRKVRTIEMKRLTVEEYREAEKLPLIVVLDDVRSMYNVGSVFRTCDSFRVEAVYLCGISCTPPATEIHKTALGAEESVSWRYFKTALEAVEELKKNGYTVFSVEQVEHSTKLHTFVPQRGLKYAVVMGNEVKGVHQVSVTTGIVIYKFAEELILR